MSVGYCDTMWPACLTDLLAFRKCSQGNEAVVWGTRWLWSPSLVEVHEHIVWGSWKNGRQSARLEYLHRPGENWHRLLIYLIAVCSVDGVFVRVLSWRWGMKMVVGQEKRQSYRWGSKDERDNNQPCLKLSCCKTENTVFRVTSNWLLIVVSGSHCPHLCIIANWIRSSSLLLSYDSYSDLLDQMMELSNISSFIRLSLCPSACPSINPSIHPVLLLVHLSTHPSIHQTTCTGAKCTRNCS